MMMKSTSNNYCLQQLLATFTSTTPNPQNNNNNFVLVGFGTTTTTRRQKLRRHNNYTFSSNNSYNNNRKMNNTNINKQLVMISRHVNNNSQGDNYTTSTPSDDDDDEEECLLLGGVPYNNKQISSANASPDDSLSPAGFHRHLINIPHSALPPAAAAGNMVKEEEGGDSHTADHQEEAGVDDGVSQVMRYNIVLVTSEASPYSKTGGLGDVCGSLPVALATRGHRVMVVSPRYLLSDDCNDYKFAAITHLDCPTKVYCSGGVQEVDFFHEYREGVDWVFVDHPCYHRPGNPYGDHIGAFGDNQFRFTLLCHAACEAPLVLPLGGFTYGDKCLFLANDWQAGLVPVLLAAKYRPHGVYKDARSIVVIHNITHQGVEPATTYGNLGLPMHWYGALEWIFPTWARTHALDTGQAVNILKGAVVTADRILTVSQGYSWEITTPEGGYGLNELLTSRKFVVNGITNGIDVTEWDPSSDKHIASHYTLIDPSGKMECKIALQKELGLPIRPECPLVGFIGRLDYQKGIDIILSATPALLQDDVQFVMLGSGEKQYEDWMRATEEAFKDKFRGWIGFNVPISHQITAGCDILLMPSRYEPCGLNQLYAMRYGTVPVVHGTGGLRDTVKTFNPFAEEGEGEGTGWVFSPLTRECMLDALRVAIRTYIDHKISWQGLMRRGMERDCSWDNAAVQYEQVFQWAFMDPPYANS